MKKINQTQKATIVILFLIFITNVLPVSKLYAQGPNAPEAAAFEPVDATDMVNLVTGDFTYVLPLLNVPSPEGGYPIALSYHAGIAMDQEASWVGLGWSLNPGAINRGVNGYPDDWEKTNVNEFFYDKGWSEDYYSFSAGVTLKGGVSVGLGLSWGSNQSLGGYVSASIGLGDGKTGPSIGASIGTNGGSIYGGVNGFNASVGTNGVGIGYGTNGDTSIGVSLNYNYNSGLSGGVSLSQKNGTFKNTDVGKYSGVGISFSSKGASLNAKVNGYGAGISKLTNGVSAGDYDVSVSTSSFFIPAYIFYVSYSHTSVKYSLYKYNSLYTSGMLYPVAANKLQPYDDSTDLSRRMHENHFMDVNVIQRFGSDNLYDDLIEDRNKNDKNNLVLPNYDNYTVNAQGLSGTISPYIHSELNLSARGRGEQNDDNEFVQYLNHDITEYMASASSGLGGNKEAVTKKHFTFTSAYNSFLRLKRSNIRKTGVYASSSDHLMSMYKTDDVFAYNAPSLSDTNRKREGNYIETYTNKEIRENTINGFIEAKEGTGLLNRRDLSVFLDDGIGAFKITTLDGKTYHYSLPVYQFESFYKNFKKVNGNGDAIASEDENFFEIQKMTPYATHWLLTAITGPDYIDKNSNGKVDEQDYGYWVEFDYGKWSDGYVWQTPNGRFEEIVDKHDSTKKTYAYSWGRRQVYYLDAIKTRTHTALFVKDVREDNMSIKRRENGTIIWNPNEAFTSKHYKYFNNSRAIKATPGEVYYYYNGRTYTSPEIVNSKKYGQVPVDYFNIREKLLRYHLIKSEKVLKLKKIIILKNEDIILNKQHGKVINNLTGYISQNKGVSILSAHAGGNTIFQRVNNLLKDPLLIKQFKKQLHQNILDVKDIEGLNLENKASKVIVFNHDYSLAKDAPNTESGKGRLTLKSVHFKGKQGKQVIPPYQFNYDRPHARFDKNSIDDWGYSKNSPQLWSLNKITTPTGGDIKINYEPDTYYAEAAHSKETSFYELIMTILPNRTTKVTFKNNSENLLDYFTKGLYCRLRHIKIEFGIVDRGGAPKIIEHVEEDRFKVIDIGSDWIVLDTTLFEYDYSSSSSSREVVIVYSNSNHFASDKTGGGIRTKGITVSDGIKNIATTEYHYKNGITSYAPTKEQKGVPYVSELPAPMVLYGSVNMINKDGNENELGNTVYHFETLEPRKEETGYIFSLGEAFRVKENQNQTFENGKVVANKYTIESRLGNIGRLKSITTQNNKNQIVHKKENSYKQDLDADGEIGVSQESHKSYKRVKKDNVEMFYVSATSKVNYPSVLESTKVTQSGFSIREHFDKHDFLTGQLLETTTTDSKGHKFKTEIIPAYTIPAYNTGSYGMGSKVDDPTNKNMLTQQAMTKTYIDVNGDWKEVGVGITTWNNQWLYSNSDESITTASNNEQRIWRKHKTYVWDGTINDDGTYQNFSGIDDSFNWKIANAGQEVVQSNSNWKNIATTTIYDHYSMPLEVKDINNNYATTKMCDDDSKVLFTANSKYYESFYTGGEYYDSATSRLDPQIRGNASLRSTDKAHTGSYSLKIPSSDNSFGAILKANEHRAGKYKMSVWVHKDNYTNARFKKYYAGTAEPFNGETVFAGDWVQLNHYFTRGSGEVSRSTIYMVISNSGTIYIDDFRMYPISSSMTSYVYNEWDELWYIIGNNGLATRFEYDEMGRLEKTYTEVEDFNGVGTGGFKNVGDHSYNYKLQ